MTAVILTIARVALAAATVTAMALIPAMPARAQVPGLRGTLVVVNKRPSTLTILDVETGRVLATLPTGEGPHEVVLSRDGSIAVVTDYAGRDRATSNTLTVIDVPGRRVARTIALGEHARPHGIVFLPGDSLVAVTTEASGHVLVVSLARGAVRHAIPTGQEGSHMVGVTADGSRGYTANGGSNSVSVLDVGAGRHVRNFDVPRQPEAINVTPDGAEVWVGSNATGSVSVLDPP